MFNSFRVLLLVGLASVWLSGCASSQMKARKEQREKVSQTSKLYCDFVNGEIFPDVEVQLNLEMAKRCDSSQPYSITNYKTSNENMGIVFCCALPEVSLSSEAKPKQKLPPKVELPPPPPPKAKSEIKAEAKASDKAEAKTSTESEPEL